MPQSELKTKEELKRILESNSSAVLNLAGERYALISDMHLGDGTNSDDFFHNEKVLLHALEDYKQKKFKLVFLGDIEDYWQFKPEVIKKQYDNSVYKKIREFGKGNVYRIWGNHDDYWSKLHNGETDPMFDESWGKNPTYEAVKFVDQNNNVVILALHGYQGSIESGILASLSKPVVWLYGFIEKILGHAPHKAEPNTKIDSNYEKIYYKNAVMNKKIIICGHSHYAIFESKCYANRLQDEIDELNKKIRETSDPTQKDILKIQVDALTEKLKIEKKWKREITSTSADVEPIPCYFNTGCCLYEYGVSCIELEDDKLRLVKWNEKFEKQNYGEGVISKYYSMVNA